MFKVGYYKNMKVQSPNVVVELPMILEGIKSGKWKDQVERYRKTGDSTIKDNLPCYTVGGVFGRDKSIGNLKSPSNLLSLDIDDFKGGLEELFADHLFKLGHSVYHVSKSCGGRGYCVLVKIKPFKDYEHFKKIYHSVYLTLESTGLGEVSKFDYLPNLNRLRFVSYDEDALTFDVDQLEDWVNEEELPINVEIVDKGVSVKTFNLGGELSDQEKFDIVLANYIEYAGDFGQKGTRHDWILGVARWSCRADIDEGWLKGHLLANYHNSARPEVWRQEVGRCVRDSYRAYSAERGSFEVTKKFSYKDILSCTNVEQVREQVYLLMADKLNYAEYLVANGKSDKFVMEEVQFLKKLISYL